MNIVFILTDQWRGDCLSVTGHPDVDTPNLDQLAHQGTVFTSAYSSCPSCIAARASVFTGLAPNGHGRLGYRDRVPWRYEHMLAQVLRDGGYQTACIGKTHFYPQGAHFGFEVMESYEGLQQQRPDYVNDYHEWLKDKSGGMFTTEFDHGIQSNSWYARPSHLPEELHNNTWVVTRGLEFIRRRDPTRPFFLNLSFLRPHAPLDPPQVAWDLYEDRQFAETPVGDWAGQYDRPAREVNDWAGTISPRLMDQARRGYYAQITHIDFQIGRLMGLMNRYNPGPTAFVFTSDHGEMLGDHNLWRKSYAFEGSAKVPTIVTIPGAEGPTFCSAPTVLEDIYPTLLDIAGVDCPVAVDGHSLAPWCAGRQPADWPAFVHGEHSACYAPENAMQFLTDGTWKYVWYPATGKQHLFNLAEDPQELHDLSDDSSASGQLKTWRTRLIDKLAARPEDGLSDGRELIAAGSPPAVRERLLEEG